MDKAVFLDRDGCINYDPGYVHKIEDFKLYPDAIKALKLLKDFRLFIITNQSGIGRGFFTLGDFKKFNDYLTNTFKKNNIIIEKTYVCPHHPDEKCGCRKPNLKFIEEAQKDFNISLKDSWVIGDHPQDVEMGKNAGCKTIYVLTGHGKKHGKELKGNVKPDFIAEGIHEAAKIIIKNNKMSKEKIKSIEELEEIVEDLKKHNKKIITTNGVFDILHIGHIRYLEEAKKLGHILIVAINSDSSTKKIKGPKRPENNENDRAEVIASLQCVDYVTIFNEENPIKILEEIKPDIHVKGGDYKPEEIIEKDVVIKNGGKVHIIRKIEGYSTTGFIQNVIEKYKE